MDPNLVIKIKYGDTLRRFNAFVDGNGSLNLDLGGLRAKILDLFKFAPDADLTLTYIDEDNDVVTLVDDDDLRDAVRQHLHPLRINVLLNTSRGGKLDTRSSASSTPMRSPRTQTNPLSRTNSRVADVLNSVPEPVRDALSKLSHDLASKATFSAPVFTEIVERLSNLGLSHLGSVPAPVPAPLSESGASEGPTEVRKASKNSGPISKSSSTYGRVAPVSTAPVDLTLDLPGDSLVYGYPSVEAGVRSILEPTALASDRKEKIQKENDGQVSGKTITSSTLFPTFPVDYPMYSPPQPSPVCIPPFSSTFNPVLDGNNKQQQPSGIGNSSTSPVGFSSQNNLPNNGQTGADALNVLPSDGLYGVHPFKRSHSHFDSMGRIFHKGVQCDGCGVYPITGPRFKSKIKEDYDLCAICFSEIGNEAEYTRMDYPVTYHSTRLFEHHPRFRTPALPHVRRRCGGRPCRPKLDSRFIRDVNIMDGTIMAPMTSFTKIWRVCNNGTIVWPQGTQLVWIGGDKFTDRVAVGLEIPVEGIHINRELDIAVDFRAPEKPGRYISYWRMSLPSGQKFGQRIWVLIQVQVEDISFEGSLLGDFHGPHLNMPPESSGAKGQNLIDVNMDPFDGPNMSIEFIKPMDEKRTSDDQEPERAVNDGVIISNSAPVPSSPEMPASMSYPIIDFSASPSEPFTVADVPKFNTVEQTLLKELEEMGFYQIDLNKEVLRKNEYNLEQSVDELCDVAEWDPILKELQEMGFTDKEMNKKLLIKNGGSIKRVVLDLIAGKKA